MLGKHVIGITGKSGSGKTTLARILASIFEDSCYLDLDHIARDAMLDENILKKAHQIWGNEIFDDSGNLLRKKLGEIVFSDQKQMDILIEISWPMIKKTMYEQINYTDKTFVIIDWAMLPKAENLWKVCDLKVIVTSSSTLRKDRIIKRDRISEKYFSKREMGNNIEYDTLECDILFNNIGDETYLNDMAKKIMDISIQDHRRLKYAVYPGSFDPYTLGHQNLVEDALQSGYDRIIIMVAQNEGKSKGMFNLQERMFLIEEIHKYDHRVIVKKLPLGMALIQYMKDNNLNVIIRGLRNITDFQSELESATLNRKISGDKIRTVMLPTNQGDIYTSSSVVRTIATLKQDYSSFVNPIVRKAMEEKLKK